MMQIFPTWFRWSFFIVLSALLTGCGEKLPTVDLNNTAANETIPDKEDAAPPLRVAVGAMISPEITREYYQRLIDVIARQAGRRAVFSQRRTYAEVNELVKTHEVDIAFVCSGPYVAGHEEFGMEMLVVPVVHGEKTYNSYIIVNTNSSIQSFEELRGKRFAFTDPHSNTGCLVPTYMLATRNEMPASFFSRIIFTGGHDNSIKAVADGIVDGAAVDSLIWKFINAENPMDTSRTKIIENSPPYGIPPIVTHPDLNNDLKQQLKQLFLTIHENSEAKPLLRRLHIDRFEEGEDSMYDSIREMGRWIDEYEKGNTP